MKITKVAQQTQPQTVAPVVTQPQQTPPSPQSPQPQPQPNSALQHVDPQMKRVLNQAIMNSGIPKKKILEFVQELFMGMGEIPLSKVKNTIEAMAAEEINATQQQAQPNAVATPDQGVVQQTDQTMVPPSG